ncbi:hypothetical protein PIB30_004379 [Stylosanthes scabra]|uniref:Ribosomal protein L34e superfamily protein n=1 Tax=Stylosanthes scabra TaxID=79078 RepID=A0ABU6U3Y0_9FABA|nr:hypothetical protein [Stylosanthes scabra]
MRQQQLLATITTAIATMTPPCPPPPPPPKPKSTAISGACSCKHSPSATLDLLILILVLFSGAFLLSSYFSYIFNSLSLLLAQSAPNLHQLPISWLLGFFAFFGISIVIVDFWCGARSRKCRAPGCKGLKKAMEFDLQLQTEENLRCGASDEIDRLPWKGGREGNPDYECLRSELRKMAPANGRAVLLFRARCGCPIAKLEGWGPKKGKRHKKSLQSVTVNGKGDHR